MREGVTFYCPIILVELVLGLILLYLIVPLCLLNCLIGSCLLSIVRMSMADGFFLLNLASPLC